MHAATKRIMPLIVVKGPVLLTSASHLWIRREPICTCGDIKLWHGQVVSPENVLMLLSSPDSVAAWQAGR